MRGPDYRGSVKYTLDGDGKMIEVFRKFADEGFYKPVKAGFRKAAVPVRKAMAAGVPRQISPIKKAIKVKESRRGLVTMVGVFAKQGVYVNRRGKQWDPWTLANWFEYGTYANRASFHKFQNARKGRSRNRPGGIKPNLFLEQAWESSKDQAASELEKYWEKNIEELCNKYNVKLD
jgi:hypothetical protein